MFIFENGDVVLVLLEDLLIILFEDVVMDGVKSLIKVDLNWVKIIFNGVFVLKEMDIFDIFMEFFWYYVCYMLLKFVEVMFDKDEVNYWLLVD